MIKTIGTALFLVALFLILLIAFTTKAPTQGRGYYWNGYSWEWRGDGQPTRQYPPTPVYPPSQIPERDLDCRGDYCYRQFREYGGQPFCRNRQGYLVRC